MSVSHLPSIFRAVQEIFPDTVLRTGFSTEHKAAFVVAADLRQGLGFKSNTARFLQGVEAHQKGVTSLNPLYVGDEVIVTAGGPQRMKVVYKRGVFHALMRSDLPKAAEFRDQVFDLLEQVEREGFVVNASAPVEQLQTMKQRAMETIDEVLEARLQERKDYRQIVRQVREAGGWDRDFADVQNMIYMGLFGMTAETIRQRQPQVNGERYKRDCKFGKAGDLRPSKVAKDFLTKEQLNTLDNGVLFITSGLALRFPDGLVTLEDIKDAALEVGTEMRASRARRQGVAA
ncbi:Bro-N domain-containing protein [Streptomyces prunicolor]|uniref:BRO-N domain-containing protein n=1 Tax=Streptomyces prunicolor TaxID=67348 RepID=UPI00224FF173|nr:Bro-N domain-containing protein [Streptomyces prunicolor]MCX5234413.1 Bro-N domain-containing protein [Streptomyces prunicolor]